MENDKTEKEISDILSKYSPNLIGGLDTIYETLRVLVTLSIKEASAVLASLISAYEEDQELERASLLESINKMIKKEEQNER